MSEQQILVMCDTDVAKARRLGGGMAAQLGLGTIASAEIEIVATELATGLLKDGSIEGELLFRKLHGEKGFGLEIIASDKSPGILNQELAVRDGESIPGALNSGLSMAQSLMDEFELQSLPGRGTVVTCRKWQQSDCSPRMNFAVSSRPYPGESVSGDAWFIRQTALFAFVAVIDVLGHGSDAHEVAVQLQNILNDIYSRPLLEIVRICHEKLSRTRGSAISLAKIDFAAGNFEHISIGNVETRICARTESVRPFCINGTIGMAMECPMVTQYPFPAGSTIIIFSDGINGRFKIGRRLLEDSPQAVAAYILDNFALQSDDATVLVGRLNDVRA